MQNIQENYPNYNLKSKFPVEEKQNGNTIQAKKNIFNKIFSTKGLISLVLLVQIILLILLVPISIDPINGVIQKYQNNQILSKAAELVKVDQSKTQILAIVSDVEKLKSESIINSEVYKDVKNGDYVIGLENNAILIYRGAENKVIYQGDSPQTKLTKAQQIIISNIVSKAKEKKVISQYSTENPQVTQITDPNEYNKIANEFYKNALKDDIIAYFPKAQIVLIYRISVNDIINSGKLI